MKVEMVISFKYYTMFLLITSLTILTTMLFYCLNRRNTPKFYSFLCFLSLCFIWSTGQTMERLFEDVNIRWLFVEFQYLSIIYISLTGLIFILFYTESTLLKNKKLISILFIPPTFFYISLLTNHLHHQFYVSYCNESAIYGPLFYFHCLFSYLYCLIALIVLAKYSIRNKTYIKKQSIIIMISLCIPLFTNIAGLVYSSFKYNNYPTMDLTPSSLILFILFVSIATFKYRFINIAPIGVGLTFNNMSESIVILDNLNTIVKYNKAFNDTFSVYHAIKVDDEISLFIKKIKGYIQNDDNTKKLLTCLEDTSVIDYNGEFIITLPETKYFNVNIKPITVKNNQVFGRIVSFSDVSDYKNLLVSLNDKNNELCEKNKELSHMYSKLKEHNAALEELTIQRERNRFAMDVHDTLGHTMTLLLKQLEIINITYKNDLKLTGEKISQTRDIVISGLNDLKRSIIGLSPERLKPQSLISSLERLIAVFNSYNIVIELNVEGDETLSDLLLSEAVFRICQEALTNSIRHGKSENIVIIIRFLNGKLKLYIIDDGCGCKKIKQGFGLSGMEKRVKALNGVLSYGSDGERGFNIYAELPYGGRKDDKGYTC